MVSWMGCWDNFQCSCCGEGELPGGKYLACDVTVRASMKAAAKRKTGKKNEDKKSGKKKAAKKY
jgi:hypothetical protein